MKLLTLPAGVIVLGFGKHLRVAEHVYAPEMPYPNILSQIRLFNRGFYPGHLFRSPGVQEEPTRGTPARLFHPSSSDGKPNCGPNRTEPGRNHTPSPSVDSQKPEATKEF